MRNSAKTNLCVCITLERTGEFNLSLQNLLVHFERVVGFIEERWITGMGSDRCKNTAKFTLPTSQRSKCQESTSQPLFRDLSAG
jgi:hypothetical protein